MKQKKGMSQKDYVIVNLTKRLNEALRIANELRVLLANEHKLRTDLQQSKEQRDH